MRCAPDYSSRRGTNRPRPQIRPRPRPREAQSSGAQCEGGLACRKGLLVAFGTASSPQRFHFPNSGKPSLRGYRASLTHCSGYLNGIRPLVWSGAGVYVADDFFGVLWGGASRCAGAFLATGFFASAFRAAAFVLGFFMPRTVQHNSP
jgi:hypothetical protein